VGLVFIPLLIVTYLAFFNKDSSPHAPLIGNTANVVGSNNNGSGDGDGDVVSSLNDIHVHHDFFLINSINIFSGEQHHKQTLCCSYFCSYKKA
jgi:hypothetical protein